MLTQEQRDEFEELGLLRIPRAVPEGKALWIADRISDHLASEESIRYNSQQYWLAERPGGFQALGREGVLDAVGDGLVPLAIDDLVGADRWQRPRHWGRVLVTFKVSDQPWEVPNGGWHLDAAPLADGKVPAITVFVIVRPLRHRGGGTVIVQGTHHLVAKRGSQDVKAKVQRRLVGECHPWLAELWSSDPAGNRETRFLEEGAVIDGIPLRVVEVTGEPGDAFLMRSDTFHTSAPNALDEPRVMLVKNVRVS